MRKSAVSAHRFARKPSVLSLIFIGLALCVAASSANAQISMGTPTTMPWPTSFPAAGGFALTIGTSSAHDPSHNVFLVVGAAGPSGVTGVIVNANGVATGPAFYISTQVGHHVNYVRTAYSQDANGGQGAFLVAWVAEDADIKQIQVHSRMVSSAGALLGSENILSDAQNQGFLQGGPAIGYSPTSKVFLVAWQGNGSTQGLKTRLVGLDGAGSGSIVTIKSSWQRDPGVTWNQYRNEFGVSFSSENQDPGDGHFSSQFAIVPASNLAGTHVTTFNTIACCTISTTMTDVAFSPLTHQYVMTWFENGPTRIRQATFNEDGVLQQMGDVSYTMGSYDSLAMAYNPQSQTILVTGLGRPSDNISAVELNGFGGKISPEISSSGERGWLNRVSASQTAKEWLPTYQDINTNNTSDPSMVPVFTTSSGGGGGTPPLDSDGDCVPDLVVQCPNQFAQTVTGCPNTPPPPPPPPTDSDGDGVPDSIDQCPSFAAQTSNGCPIQSAPNGDFTGDGVSELVFTSQSTGMSYAWHMNGTTLTGGAYLWDVPSYQGLGWKVVGTSDLTGDGKADLLWQNQITGAVRLFKMDFQSKVGEQTNGLQANPALWRISGTGDFNGDGKADILWRNKQTGELVVWYMTTVGDQAVLAGSDYLWDATHTVHLAPSLDWQIVGTSDFDGDGKRDLAWQNDDGRLQIWQMNGTTLSAQYSVGQVDPNWRLAALANVAGDPFVDAIFQHRVTGQMFVWARSGNTFVPYGYLSPNAVALDWVLSGPR
jgi:hypothetical protein